MLELIQKTHYCASQKHCLKFLWQRTSDMSSVYFNNVTKKYFVCEGICSHHSRDDCWSDTAHFVMKHVNEKGTNWFPSLPASVSFLKYAQSCRKCEPLRSWSTSEAWLDLSHVTVFWEHLQRGITQYPADYFWFDTRAAGRLCYRKKILL